MTDYLGLSEGLAPAQTTANSDAGQNAESDMVCIRESNRVS